MIYALTNASSSKTNGYWFPGHAALYLGTTDPNGSSNNGSTIVESTPIDPALEQDFDGVQYSNLDKFKTLSGQHIFMGARRPSNKTISTSQRNSIASYAISKVNIIGYRDVGGGSFLNISDTSKISCVALTELAYSAAGIDVVPEICEILLFPIRQFNRTDPVNEITVHANEPIDFLVYGLVKTGRSYSKEDTNYTMTATSTSDIFTSGNAHFTHYVNAYDFNWTPSSSEVGQSFVVSFVLSGSGFSPITQNLTIHVSGNYFPMVDGSQYQYTENQTIVNSSGTTTQTLSVARRVTAGASYEITETYTHGSDTATFVYHLSDTGGFWVYNNVTEDGEEVITYSPYWKILPTDLENPQVNWSNNFTMTLPSSEGTDRITVTLQETDVVGDNFESITVNGTKYDNVLKITRTQNGTIPDYTGKDSEGRTVTIRTDEYKVNSTEYYAPGVGSIKLNSEQKIKQTLIRQDGSSTTDTETTTVVREIISHS